MSVQRYAAQTGRWTWYSAPGVRMGFWTGPPIEPRPSTPCPSLGAAQREHVEMVELVYSRMIWDIQSYVQ
jgi:hypothetical protein